MSSTHQASSSERRLAAIMFTDIVGYTSMMGKDSAKALDLVRKSKEIQKPLVEKHNGKWLKEMGDGALVQFSTALDAVNCAIEIQEQARAKFDGKLRIGIHSGDITIENNDVYGDGVNVASRLEAIADPGGIYLSDAIEKAIRGQTEVQAKYLGEMELKNVDYGVRTYALQGVGLPVPEMKEEKHIRGHLWAEIERRGIIRTGIVYIVVSLLLIMLLKLVGNMITGIPDWTSDTLPVILVILFPVAMYMGWNYELSPQGFVRTTSKQSWENPYSVGQRKPLTSNTIIIVLLGIVVAAALLPDILNNPEREQEGARTSDSGFFLGEKSIAVLPFENFSSDPEQDYFSDGITEDILNYLAKVSGLRVKSRTSTVQYKKTEKTINEIGTELGVAYVLEGSVRKSGNMVRIVAQLINTNTDEHLWSETYDRELTEIFSIQSEVARDIAAALEVQLTQNEASAISTKNTNIEAYDYLLQAREILNEGFVEAIRYNWYFYGYIPSNEQRALILLQKAIDADPDLEGTYLELGRIFGALGNSMARDSVLKVINKAIALDPSSADAYLMRSRLMAEPHFGNYKASRADLQKAASLGPNNPDVMLGLAMDQINEGEYAQAAEWMIKSSQLAFSKSDPRLLVRWGYVFWLARDFEETRNLWSEAYRKAPTDINAIIAMAALARQEHNYAEELKYAEELYSLLPWAGLFEDNLGWGNYLTGNLDKAIDHWQKIKDMGSMHSRHRLAFAKFEKGETKEALKLLLEKMHDDSTYVKNTPGIRHGGRYYDLALCNAHLGNKEEAYTWLEKAFNDDIFLNGVGDWWINNDPMLENLKGEPRFENMRAKFNARNEEIGKQFRTKLNELSATDELGIRLR